MRNYVTVPSEYEELKQIIDINFNGVDLEMQWVLWLISEANIIVREEVSEP